MSARVLDYDGSLNALVTDWRSGRPVWGDPAILAGGLPRRAHGDRLYQGVNALILWQASRSLGLPLGTRWRRRGRSSAPCVELVVAVGRPLKLLGYPQVTPDPQTMVVHAGAAPAGLASSVIDAVRRAPGDPLRVRLRRALGKADAEQLIVDLALAFVGGWLRAPLAEVGPTPARMRPHHLPDAAHLAWRAVAPLFVEVPRSREAQSPPVAVRTPAVDARALGRAMVGHLRDGSDPLVSVEWQELRRRHQRATWLHGLPMDVPALAEATARSVDPVLAHALGGRVRDLYDAARVLGHPMLGPFDETTSMAAVGGPGTSSWPGLAAALTADPWEIHHIRRSDGGLRRLEVPPQDLRLAQRRLAGLLTRGFPAPGQVAAFAPGRSVAWHARAHAGARLAVTMDIQDFFGSVRAAQVERWLTERPYHTDERRLPFHPFEGWSDAARAALLDLMFRRDGPRTWLPQGAPSSPAAANLAAAPMDRYARLLLDRHFPGAGVRYTRYADDLVVSVEDSSCRGFLERAPRLLAGAIRSMGWRPHATKQRTWAAESGIDLVVCGLRVPRERDGAIRLTRDLARRARAAAHALRDAPRRAGLRGDRDIGLVSFAYSATGNPCWLARSSRQVRRLAESLVDADAVEAFLRGWEEG